MTFALIRRRHVFYVEGYDPQGAEGYYSLFGRELKRFVQTWSVEADLRELTTDSQDVAHWDVATKGSNWQTATRYSFVRFEHFIRANMRLSRASRMARSLAWAFDDLMTGTLWRTLRASWRFVLHLALLQVPLLVWVAIALAAGALGAAAATQWLGLPLLIALVAGVAIGAAAAAALLPLADRSMVIQVANGWPHMRDFARGRPTGYDQPLEAFAQALVAAAGAGDADEILIVGHSAGGMVAPVLVARALELDPDLGRHGPRVTLLTVGSLLPAFALHPAAERTRAAIRRLALEPAVRWVDCQARKDVMNFWDFDPVGGCGVEVGAERRNPIIWPVRLRDALTDDAYDRMRHAHFRMHYQYVMANNRRAPYDYFMLVCGPVAATEWAEQPDAVYHSFSSQGAYGGPDTRAAQVSLG